MLEEKAGDGQMAKKMLKILFEGHVFWRELLKEWLNPFDFLEGNNDILYRKFTKKFYKGGLLEHERLERACKINEQAALRSASWGMFQIMGFNYKHCGCASVGEFVARMASGNREHLLLFVNFIKNCNLGPYLAQHNWAGFARGYNGPKYKENNYDVKLCEAFNKYKIN